MNQIKTFKSKLTKFRNCNSLDFETLNVILKYLQAFKLKSLTSSK